MKNTVIPLIGVSCLLFAGCTGSFEKVRGAVNAAPDWYDERRQEIRGEGYPEVIDVPVIEAGQEPGQTLEASKARATVLRTAFEDARAAAPADIAAEIEAMRVKIRSEFAGLPAETDFLTEDEIAAIRAAFDVPRVTRGLRTASR